MILELHSHTDHSRGNKIYYDGVTSPEDMVKGAKKAGADGIFITDHNQITGAYAAQKFAEKHGVKVFLGEEITSASGDIVALGVQKRIAPGMTVEDTMDQIHAQGGIGIAVHPFDIKRNGLKEECLKCDAVEVFNSMNLDKYSNKKCLNLVKKHNKPMTAGSDAHCAEMLGHGQIKTKAETLDEILKEIKSGKARLHKTEYIPLNVIMNLSLERLRKSYDYTMSYMENHYSWPKRKIGQGMLSLVKRDTIGLGGFYKSLAFIAFGSVILYGQFRRLG